MLHESDPVHVGLQTPCFIHPEDISLGRIIFVSLPASLASVGLKL